MIKLLLDYVIIKKKNNTLHKIERYRQIILVLSYFSAIRAYIIYFSFKSIITIACINVHTVLFTLFTSKPSWATVVFTVITNMMTITITYLRIKSIILLLILFTIHDIISVPLMKISLNIYILNIRK